MQLGTAGSDPDGDAVSLKGIAVAPRLGRIVQSGLDWFSYESFPDSFGTDSFQVTVADKYGAEALLDVRIGVAPRAEVNQPPVAFDDQLLVRPGRSVEYAVLTNDVDADGDPLTVLPELTTAPGVEASVDSGLVQVPAPRPGEDGVARSSVGYSIGDGLGGTDSAFLTVTADADAPLYAPVTRDDAADLTEIAGQAPGDRCSIDVLRNDGDLDGARSDLVLETLDPSVSRSSKASCASSSPRRTRCWPTRSATPTTCSPTASSTSPAPTRCRPCSTRPAGCRSRSSPVSRSRSRSRSTSWCAPAASRA